MNLKDLQQKTEKVLLKISKELYNDEYKLGTDEYNNLYDVILSSQTQAFNLGQELGRKEGLIKAKELIPSLDTTLYPTRSPNFATVWNDHIKLFLKSLEEELTK